MPLHFASQNCRIKRFKNFRMAGYSSCQQVCAIFSPHFSSQWCWIATFSEAGVALAKAPCPFKGLPDQSWTLSNFVNGYTQCTIGTARGAIGTHCRALFQVLQSSWAFCKIHLPVLSQDVLSSHTEVKFEFFLKEKYWLRQWFPNCCVMTHHGKQKKDISP